MTRYILFFTFVLFFSCTVIKKHKIIKSQSTQRLEAYVTIPVTYEYYLYLPSTYDELKLYPLILFLHGIGERGKELSKVKKWGLPKMADSLSLPFIVVSPQCPSEQFWKPHELKTLLDYITKNYKVDLSRIYVTGLSMGGYGTYDLAIAYPSYFAAIAPLSAGGKTFRAKNIAHIPVWAFHGAKDEVISLKTGQDMVDAINKAGGNAKLTVFPEAKHVCWDRVYANKELYKWFLSHKN